MRNKNTHHSGNPLSPIRRPSAAERSLLPDVRFTLLDPNGSWDQYHKHLHPNESHAIYDYFPNTQTFSWSPPFLVISVHTLPPLTTIPKTLANIPLHVTLVADEYDDTITDEAATGWTHHPSGETDPCGDDRTAPYPWAYEDPLEVADMIISWFAWEGKDPESCPYTFEISRRDVSIEGEMVEIVLPSRPAKVNFGTGQPTEEGWVMSRRSGGGRVAPPVEGLWDLRLLPWRLGEMYLEYIVSGAEVGCRRGMSREVM